LPFTFKKLEIEGVVLIKPKVFSDERGFMMETYKYPDFKNSGINATFVQDNRSKSVKKGIIRGLHYQKAPHAQAKLIMVVRGSILDVALDIRKTSPTFGKWVSAELSANNRKMLFMPEGFAHGFCTLEDNTEVHYKSSSVFAPEYTRGIAWNAGDLNISWPIKEPILSRQDSNLPNLKDADIE